jgi:hypothetical protein
MEGAMRNMKLKLSALLLILLSAANPSATQITLDLDTAYVTPTVTPVGTSPWLVAEFTDLTQNSVQLTMNTTGLAAGTSQFVGNWFFNVTDPLLGLLNFQYASGIQASILLAPDQRVAGGGQLFDIEFDFVTPAGQLVPGAQSVYLISSLDPQQPISAESFASLSVSSSSQVNYYSAALVEGIGSELSSWIAAPTVTTPGPGPGPTPVPEPATVVLLGLALTGLTFFYGKRKTARHN